MKKLAHVRLMIPLLLSIAFVALPSMALSSHSSHKPTPQAIVFISFSMPALALRQTLRQAHHYHLPVVIRGLINNNFRTTVYRLFELTKHKDQGGVAIDPLWFRQFGITQVPAVVVSHRPVSCQQQTRCPQQDYDVIYGNLPLPRSLQLLSQTGTAAPDIAKQLLREYPYAEK